MHSPFTRRVLAIIRLGLEAGQDVIGTFANPVKPTGHIAILEGSLAPEGAVGKITGKEGTRFQASYGKSK